MFGCDLSRLGRFPFEIGHVGDSEPACSLECVKNTDAEKAHRNLVGIRDTGTVAG